MIKFIHKNHIHQDAHTKALIIYYSLSDIVLGLLLVVLVGFFIYNYLEFSFRATNQNGRISIGADTQLNPNKPTVPVKKVP